MPPDILLPLSLPPRTLLLCSKEMPTLEELHETAEKIERTRAWVWEGSEGRRGRRRIHGREVREKYLGLRRPNEPRGGAGGWGGRE